MAHLDILLNTVLVYYINEIMFLSSDEQKMAGTLDILVKHT